MKVQNIRVLSEEERHTLDQISPDEIIEEVQYYMKKKLQNSEQNVRSVARTLSKLVNAHGVTHQRSNRKNNVFSKNIKVSTKCKVHCSA